MPNPLVMISLIALFLTGVVFLFLYLYGKPPFKKSSTSAGTIVISNQPVTSGTTEKYSMGIANERCAYRLNPPKPDADGRVKRATIDDYITALKNKTYADEDKEYCTGFDKDNTNIYYLDNTEGVLPEGPNDNKKTCPDGSTSCLFYEKIDANGYLTGIKNDKGQELAQIIIDDVYSGKLKMTPDAIQNLKSGEGGLQYNFEKNELYIRKVIGYQSKSPEPVVEKSATTGSAAPQDAGNVLDDRKPIYENVLMVPGVLQPIGVYILLCAAFFKVYDKPKPNFKYAFKSSTITEQRIEAFKFNEAANSSQKGQARASV